MNTWDDLSRELDAWGNAGLGARFWWRDDDAIDHTPELDQLLALAPGVPRAIAVIPARATPDLARRLNRAGGEIAVLQHGYDHTNHGILKKAELGSERPAAHLAADLAMGWQNLTGFSGRIPVLVPPWNRIAPALLTMLPSLGYTGLSRAGRRASGFPGLTEVNIQIDPVDWAAPPQAGRRTLRAASAIIADIAAELALRRTGAAPNDPIGLLTHHPVLDEDGWEFTAECVARIEAHEAADWVAAKTLFPAIVAVD